MNMPDQPDSTARGPVVNPAASGAPCGPYIGQAAADMPMTTSSLAWLLLLIAPMALVTALVSGCTPAALLNLALPSDHYRRVEALAYADSGLPSSAAASSTAASTTAVVHDSPSSAVSGPRHPC